MKNAQILENVTNKFVEAVQAQGKMPWQNPWKNAGFPKNFVSGKSYQGINLMITLFSEFESLNWLTFNQTKALGGSVKKGSKGTHIVFWEKKVSPTGEKNAKGEEIVKEFFYLKPYIIFNEEQIEGIDFSKKQTLALSEEERIAEVEAIFNATEIKVVESIGDIACYSPMKDEITMPKFAQFKGKTEYYATLAHEMIHATGHVSRLKREGVAEMNYFGSERYSFEELVAEIGSCMFLSLHGIQNEKVEANQMAYVQGWIRVLKNDPTMIMKASKEAQKAIDWIANKSTILA
jgi:antirestriction protein ArdC